MALESIENLDDKLADIGAKRLAEGGYAIAAVVTRLWDDKGPEANAIPYNGIIQVTGISSSGRGFDRWAIEGVLYKESSAICIGGTTNSLVLEFKRTYQRNNPENISYRLERKSSFLWVGTYTITNEWEEITGDAQGLIVPRRGTVQKKQLTHR